jgi:Flp pilus assembly protein TadG
MSSHKKQKGAILVMAAGAMVLFLGIAALTVDVAHIYVTRSELQNAADSAALAAGGLLYPTLDDGSPNWSAAASKAQAAISLNKANNATLTDCTVDTGYFDLSGQVSGIQSPATVTTPGPDEIAAVKVTVSKSVGNNGGPLNLFFGFILGVTSIDVSASAIAVTGSPNSVGENTLFPLAMPLNLYSQYWDSVAGKPLIDPETGLPYVFQIGIDGTNGQWTSFETDSNSVPAVQDLIENGNPTGLAIGDSVWIVPGVKTSIYDSVPSDIDVTVAIVSDTTTHSEQTITGFGALHIYFAEGANGKYIQASFLDNTQVKTAEPGGGAYYGSYTPARLAG